MKENNIETSDKIYAPLVDAMTIAYKNPTYQFHIPGHTKGQGVYKKFKDLVGERILGEKGACRVHGGGFAGTMQAFVPNEEIRQELIRATRRRQWNELIVFWQESEQLLNDTLDMDGVAVAAQMEKIHSEYVPAIQYNNENSLGSVLALAYLSAMQYYFKPIRELPAGRGFADFVFIPKPEYRNDYPALIVELKWNRNAKTAMKQIKEKRYPDSLLGYTGDILLVGINYDKKTKEHQCLIEQYVKK